MQLYDSNAGRQLTPCLEVQLAQMYGSCQKNGQLLITQMPVQQQDNGRDCGLFAIAFAYHAAQGDDLTSLNFDSTRMRKHLTDCFKREELSPFPLQDGEALKQCAGRRLHIPLHCTCSLPKSYDKMVECYCCEKLYHRKCVSVSDTNDPWFCSECTM